MAVARDGGCGRYCGLVFKLNRKRCGGTVSLRRYMATRSSSYVSYTFSLCLIRWGMGRRQTGPSLFLRPCVVPAPKSIAK